MADFAVRQLHGDEMREVIYNLSAYCFRSSPPMTDKASYMEILKQRAGIIYMAGFENGLAVAGGAATPMTQNVRGAFYKAGAVWSVATQPGARRKGYARAVLAALHAALRESGHVLADLYPFRESFYDHYGYASFPLPRKVYLAPAALAPLLDMDLPGTVEQMLIADGIDAYRSLARKVHPRVHGMAMFDQTETILPQRNIYWVALAKISGETAGAMVYDLKGEDLADFTMRVVRFHYLTSQARYLLLSWIARHIDQASRVDMRLPAYEQPEMWLADLQVKSESQVRAPMGRVLDVARIGGMPTGPGRFAARIVDPLCPWNEGIWQFETVHGVLDVRPAGQADCSLGVQALAALIFGTHDPADFAMRGWGDPPENVQATMKVMFPPLLPHLNEQF